MFVSANDGASWTSVTLYGGNDNELSLKVRSLSHTIDEQSILIGTADNKGDVYVATIDLSDITRLNLAMVIDATGGQTEDIANCGGYSYAAINKQETGGLYRTNDVTGSEGWEKILSGNPHSLALDYEASCAIYLGFYDVIRVYDSHENFDSANYETIDVIGYVEDFSMKNRISGGVGPYFISNFPESHD